MTIGRRRRLGLLLIITGFGATSVSLAFLAAQQATVLSTTDIAYCVVGLVGIIVAVVGAALLGKCAATIKSADRQK